METPTSIKQDFVFRMNEMLANLVINEEENKRIREQLEVVKEKYEKEELALIRMEIAYKKAGFININAYNTPNKYFREYEDLKMRVEELDHTQDCLKLIARMKKDFGEQSVLVPTEEFNQILLKYNLVCGRMDEFYGTVPFDKLANIARIRSLIMSSSYWSKKLQKHKATRYLLFTEARSDDYMFIAAPQECFKNNPKELNPFVCCLTKYGVMVLEAWDIEAQDKTLAYYREQESLISLAVLNHSRYRIVKWLKRLVQLIDEL